jgi:hypothetical protein
MKLEMKGGEDGNRRAKRMAGGLLCWIKVRREKNNNRNKINDGWQEEKCVQQMIEENNGHSQQIGFHESRTIRQLMLRAQKEGKKEKGT